MDKTQKITPEKHKLFWIIFGAIAIIYVAIAMYFERPFSRYLQSSSDGQSMFYISAYYELPVLLLCSYWFILYFRKKFSLTFVIYFFIIQIISIFLIMSQTLFRYTYGVDYSSLRTAVHLTLFLMLFDVILTLLCKKKIILHVIFTLFIALVLFLLFILTASMAVLG